MIDSSATENFISKDLINRKRFSIRKKANVYDLIIIDEKLLTSQKNKRVNQETESLSIALQRHHEEIIFDVIHMINHELVLEMPWLKKHNLKVDWERRIIEFEKCDCVITAQSTHRQRSMMNEKQSRRSIARCELAALIKNDPITKSDSTDTDLGQSSQQVRVSEESHVSSEILEIDESIVSTEILVEYRAWKDLFREEMTTVALSKHQSWNYEIKLESEKQLTFESIYALSEKKLRTFRDYLKTNMKKKFIRKSQSSTEYSILFILKKNEKLRLCVNYRKLNDITIKNRYSLSNISELQDRLFKTKYFIKSDLRDEYHLIRMKKEEKWKTAFRTRYDHYEYTIMSFELTNVSTTFQHLINDTLQKYLDIFVIAYLNDILIYSKTLKKHVEHVSKVLKCLKKRDLRLKSSKCEFHKKDVDYLNFVIDQKEVRIDSNKIKVVKKWQTSTNVKKIQFFLEFVNYNRKFIKDYFKKAISLTRLTAKNIEWSWEAREEAAFRELQQACVTESVLKMFDLKKLIRIESNASNLAIEACLNQEHDDKWHSVVYLFRKLSSAEQNYDVHDKKLLVIIIVLESWRMYAEEASKLTIYTDHKNLLHFTTTKQLNRRQVRWSKLLGQYKFTILYTSGKKNDRADALSRRSDHIKSKKIFDHNILKVNQNESLSANKHELNATLRIIRDDQEQFLVEKEKLQISKNQIDECIKKHHDDSLQRHSSVSKTLQLLRRNCQFSHMRQHVEAYIKRCLSCQQNKHATHAAYGEIQYQESSKSSWNEVTMNFIIKLSKSKDLITKKEYDAILIIVDRLIKYSHIIVFKEKYTAKQLEAIILDRLIRYHDISKRIISDRDKLFTFNY